MTHPEIRSFITATADENEREFVDDFVALWSSNRVTFANLRDLLEAYDEAMKALGEIATVAVDGNGRDYYWDGRRIAQNAIDAACQQQDDK